MSNHKTVIRRQKINLDQEILAEPLKDESDKQTVVGLLRMEAGQQTVVGLPHSDATQPLAVPPTMVVHRPNVGAAPVVQRRQSLALLPAHSLVSAFAILLLAVADKAARNGVTGTETLFWAALLILCVPIILRLLSPAATRQERIGLVLLVAMGMYLVKILHSPSYFTFFDEFLHWRTALDITRTQHLFATNSLLPVSPLYPGLEIVTTALASLSNLSIFQAGLLVIGIGRLLLTVSLFLVFERLSRSSRAASIGVILYMGNPNFVYFDGQFGYESLALPLATVVMLAVASHLQSDERGGWRRLLLIVLGIVGVVLTHHLTAYLLTAFLWVWMAWAFVRTHDGRQWARLCVIALVATISSLGWALLVGNATSGYLLPVLNGALQDARSIVTNEMASRELFKSAAGYTAPIWERLVGLGAVAFILLALPFGVYQVWRWQRRNTLALALGCVVFAYPASLGLRFTAHGWEISNRTSEFLFIAMAFVLAISVAWFMRLRGSLRLKHVGITAWIMVIVLGGMIAGWPPWAREPGPYMVSADTRSIEPEGIQAAEWTQSYLGTDNRIGTDRINRILTLTYGLQHPVSLLNDKVDIASLFYAPQVTSSGQALIKELNLHYLIVDYRLTTALPAVGAYFESDSPVTPMLPAALEKFNGLPDVNRIFDTGDIGIYDVSRLNNGP